MKKIFKKFLKNNFKKFLKNFLKMKKKFLNF